MIKKLCCTGLPCYKVYEQLSNLFQPLLSKHPSRRKVCCPIQFYWFDEALSLFNISSAAVSSTLRIWINLMCVKLNCLIPWPDAETLSRNRPVILETLVKGEAHHWIFIERPTLHQRKSFFGQETLREGQVSLWVLLCFHVGKCKFSTLGNSMAKCYFLF